MTEILVPTASDLVRCCIVALSDEIAPALAEGKDRSTLATVLHLLRYVDVRIEHEGQALLDELLKVRSLLGETVPRLRGRLEMEQIVRDIDTVLAREPDPGVYPSLHRMAVDVAELRRIIGASLRVLQAADDPADVAIRSSLRDYIRWQIEMEATLVEPSFRGAGPRR